MTKKKSIWAFVLALCLIVPAMFMMTACGHKHTAVTEWSSDATYHWHVCEDEKCQEQLDKAEHTWDAGVITKEATFLEDGEKTYTCSVCKRTKTEAVAYNYVDLNYVEKEDTQTYTKFTVTEAGTYYFRYEVKNCGFGNGYYWINMNKVGGGLQQTDTTHAQAKIYDANKQLIKTGMYTRAAGQFGAVETSSDTPEIVRELMENGVMSLDFLLNNKKMWFIGHFRTEFMQKRD